jgi:hypothetical protein
MADAVRVMLEHGKKKRVVACAFEWPGWDRSAKIGEDVLSVLAAYRPRYAKVAELAGFGAEFGATGKLKVVEHVEGNGMTDYYGVSGRAAAPENDPMTDAECERKIALLRASWTTFDDAAARVSTELRKGPRGGGREKDHIIRHVNGAEIHEFAPKVGVKVPLEIRDDAGALRAYRNAFIEAIRDHHARGEPARSWDHRTPGDQPSGEHGRGARRPSSRRSGAPRLASRRSEAQAIAATAASTTGAHGSGMTTAGIAHAAKRPPAIHRPARPDRSAGPGRAPAAASQPTRRRHARPRHRHRQLLVQSRGGGALDQPAVQRAVQEQRGQATGRVPANHQQHQVAHPPRRHHARLRPAENSRDQCHRRQPQGSIRPTPCRRPTGVDSH